MSEKHDSLIFCLYGDDMLTERMLLENRRHATVIALQYGVFVTAITVNESQVLQSIAVINIVSHIFCGERFGWVTLAGYDFERFLFNKRRLSRLAVKREDKYFF